MFKKLIIASAIFSISTGIAVAAPYIGITLGAEAGSWQLRNSAAKNTNFSPKGVHGGIFAGYGDLVSESIYLGGEIFADLSSANTGNHNIDNVGTTARLRTTYSYGASFIPGVKIGADTMVYAKVGVVRTRFELNQNPSPSIVNYPSENTVTGGQLGLGVQTGLTKCVALRGEYVYSKYSKFNANSNRISPSNNQFNVGLVYNFG